MPFCFYRMRGRSGPVSESKFELKTLKVSNDTLNVSATLIFQLHAKNHKNKTVFFLLDILLWRDHKGWLAIAKLKPLSLFISLLSMPKKAFDNVKIEK